MFKPQALRTNPLILIGMVLLNDVEENGKGMKNKTDAGKM